MSTSKTNKSASQIDQSETASDQEAPPAPRGLRLRRAVGQVDWKRVGFILLGLALFSIVYFSPAWPDAVDPNGEHSVLTREGKAALALFLLAATWWVTEVIPIGVTAIGIGVIQALFLIRPSRVAFTDFMDSSVWFIFASIMIGIVFTRTGLAKRMAYRMLVLVGERTSMIYLGCFVMTAGLAHIMAHTAVAAVVFPLFMSIHALYEEKSERTRFGKGLFIGMAFAAGAGSIITLLGAARGAVAISFFKDMVGREITFFELSKYMFPLGWVMVFLVWGLAMVFFRPEKKRIPGLRDRAKSLHARLGPMSRNEIMALVIVGLAIMVLSLRSFIPALEPLDKSGVILVSTILFFLFKVLSVKELEEIPWNIILLFGGAMSIGYCLYQTEAAKWLAINWLVLFQGAHWFLFLGGVTFFVLIMTNLIMNVAAIAISLPVALVLAPYLGVAPEVILFCSLAAAGMPFLFLVGAAPNAIAYESKQFTSGEFFRAGIPASLILMLVLAAFVSFVWPLMGMPVTIG
jgi:sodium-dependent dicarboxylate transporter 2/3/5